LASALAQACGRLYDGARWEWCANGEPLLSETGTSLAQASAREQHALWRGATIYQIYPWSFADSNSDGIGDLAGITARLDYVRDLGVDAIWLSPFFTSPMADFGYDVADFCDVDPRFGSLADFDALVTRAHGLGLKVIIDQVYSHTSDQHAWFGESRVAREGPKADWYVWADAKADGAPPNNWQSVFGGPAWTWDARRRQYYFHNFLASQPDLNVHNTRVQDALLDVMAFWIGRGVDGFRLDAVNFFMHDTALRDNPARADRPSGLTRTFDFQEHVYTQAHAHVPAFLERLRACADAHGGRFLLAEIGGAHSEALMKLYTEQPARLDSAYDFRFLYAQAITPALVRSCADGWSGAQGEGFPSWAFSNHDAPRAASRFCAGADREACARQLLLLLAALRGNIFVYQGEELGLPQGVVAFERLRDPEAIANWPHTLGRDGARTPMPWIADAPFGGFSTAEPWLPAQAAHASLAVDVQARDADSMLNFTRRVLALRRAHEALRAGAMILWDAPEPLAVFQRGEDAGAILCAFNLGDAPAPWRLPEGWRVLMAVNCDGGAGDALPARAGVLAGRS